MIGREAALGTRVARRIFALFLLCAIVPVALAIAVSYGRVQSALLDERISTLGHAAESYATTLLERLLGADRVARALAVQPDIATASAKEIERYFRVVAAVPSSGPPRAILGDAARVPTSLPIDRADRRLLQGEASVFVAGTPGAERSVWMVRLQPAGGQGDLLVAELQPAYLWGHADELPYLTGLCVLDRDRAPLHCPAELNPEALARVQTMLATSPSGHLRWDSGASGHLAGFREVFLNGAFRAGSWPIILTQPDELALAPVRDVRAAVLPAILLGLAIAALLAIVQVRRTMTPLRDLADATRRIAARDFGARVRVERDDELGELGKSFNEMSERLGRQFHALGALAEIDAVILSKVDIERVSAIVLRRMQEMVPADRWVLLLADPAASRTFRAHAPEGTPSRSHGVIVKLAQAEETVLVGSPEGFAFGRPDAATRATTLQTISPTGGFALPILLEGRLAGVIVGALPRGRTLDAEEVRLLRDLADRVAVALATAARERELYHRAHFDPLTQLPNRLMFTDELTRELARAERLGSRLALLFLDLDGFASVNDTLGHAAGDALLVRAAERITACVRKADLAARLGGDEFAVALTDLRDPADAAVVARMLSEALAAPFDIGHGETFVSASLGIAVYPTDGTTAQELLRHSDMAMYRAKESGRGAHVFFEEAMNREAQNRFALDRELRAALDERQFVLYYQPQLDLATNRIVGAEALIRWNHPTRGLVPPGPFIGFAEESGHIERIGEWALGEACAQFAAWRAAGVQIDHVSVNVSPRQFRKRDFVESVGRAVAAARIEPRALRLEITESVLVDGSESAGETLALLVALGTPLELDDFGTGYSSLAYLQRLPVATIKLDRSFIVNIAASEEAQAIAHAAVTMAHALNKEIVAEGVETPEQLELLRRWGCDAIQGYLLSKPVPPDAFAALVRAATGPERALRLVQASGTR
ncbi:MAG: EAL domain-containing protein [Burkholderiales bacterium]|jgi:diguanylate cyclase (GGDEF)-like protein|nr:EAL domain-containing protein [Burkholderiales bacterium]